MTNSEIIYKAALSHGFTEDQLLQLLEAYKGDLPFHTFQEWKSRGYSVKKGEHAIFTTDLWKYTSKPSKAMMDAAAQAGKDAPEEVPHYYKKLSHLFSINQVERIKRKLGKK